MSFKNVTFESNDTNINISLYNEETGNLSIVENLLYPITLVIPITVIYVIIFITGLVGNVTTCIVIARNKCLHTATNYYLFSLAISDLLLLVCGLPPETYRLWSPETYVFGEAFCILQGFAAETSANATVLTITAFTVERYLAICHPFLSHTMSKLSRAIKYVIAIWIIALCLAAPQAMQFGVEYEEIDNGFQRSRCTVVSTEFYIQRAFEISTFVFFVGPMTLITVLYILIGLKLQNAKLLSIQRTNSSCNGNVHETTNYKMRATRNAAAQKRVIKMLVAVVVAFFICWAPFHAQRLLAVYLSTASPEAQETFVKLYVVLMYTSGVLYFISTTVNPVLYHIMSKKFRETFKATFLQLCCCISRPDNNMYSSLFRQHQSFRAYKANSQTENIPVYNRDTVYYNSKHNNQNNKSTKLPDNNTEFKETVLIQERIHGFRSRVSSDTSQITVLTNLSKSITEEKKNWRKYPLARSVTSSSRIEAARRKHLERQNRGILSYRMFKLFTKQGGSNNNNFSRQGSVVSGRSTNTISNSSLQDVDDNEFNRSELAQYVENKNNELTQN
ncbi:hypothetical protein FQA39_LY10596 [Lamprigera yunnana]|nr:hypothetical protein FQA39_LY10596 [Lamprigera yunnana]